MGWPFRTSVTRAFKLKRYILLIIVLLLILVPTAAKAEKTYVSLSLRNPNRSLYEPLRAYMITLRRAIQDNWSQSLPHKGNPWVFFSINPDGSLENVEIKNCGGFRTDDDAAIDAVSKCFPFEHAPRGFNEALKIDASFKPCDTLAATEEPARMNRSVSSMGSNFTNTYNGFPPNYIRPMTLPPPTYIYSYSQWTPFVPNGYSPSMPPPNIYTMPAPNYPIQNGPGFPTAYGAPYGIGMGPGPGWYQPNNFGGNYQRPYGGPYMQPQFPVAPQPTNGINIAYQCILKADALKKQNHIDEAIEVLDKAAQFDPNKNSQAVHGRLASLLGDQNKWDEALIEYRTMYRLEPHSAGAELGIASCYQKLGKLEPAMRALQKFLSDHPGDRQCETVRRELTSLQDADQSWRSSDPEASDYLDCLVAKGLYKWPKNRFPLKVYFSPTDGVKGFRKTYNSYLFEALSVWLESTGQSLQCTKCDTEEQADIVCKWSDDRKEVTGMEQGITTPRISKQAADADWLIEKASIEIWTMNATGRSVADAQTIKATCLHEAGHALGLSHSPNNRDAMFFIVNNAPEISERDRNTIIKLYSMESSIEKK